MQKHTCIVATHNLNKLKEMKEILQTFPLELVSLKDLNYDKEILENGNTFEENALLKVQTLQMAYPDAFILADDSGLCIDCLDGAPGIYSARFGGENADYSEKFRLLYEALKKYEFSKWTAQFVCVIALAFPQKLKEKARTYRADWEGRISLTPSGDTGFGYDPIFYLPTLQKTVAELGKEEKNRISHRAQALKKLQEDLALFFQQER